MKVVIGLGNPGSEYDNTRHNIGFMVLNHYLGDVNWSLKFNSLIFTKMIGSHKVVFVKPQTFMNNSGMAVASVVNYYKVDIEDILVIQDDLDENIGSYKIKIHSSSGGHNGIKSIISYLNSMDFPRLKIGINSEYRKDVIDFVLGKFSTSEMEIIDAKMKTFEDVITCFIKRGIDQTMNYYNKK